MSDLESPTSYLGTARSEPETRPPPAVSLHTSTALSVRVLRWKGGRPVHSLVGWQKMGEEDRV